MNHNRFIITLRTDAQEQQMKHDSVECIRLTRECQLAPRNGTICKVAQACWNDKLINPFNSANRNNYDMRQPCNNSDPDPVCDNSRFISDYLNSPEVRKYLNVDARVPAWHEDSADVGTSFTVDGDWCMPFHEFVADMLDDGLRVLVYAGDADLMCNWIGNQAWTLALDWQGKDGYNAEVDDPSSPTIHYYLMKTAPSMLAWFGPRKFCICSSVHCWAHGTNGPTCCLTRPYHRFLFKKSS
ncbi:unnamed protein product [Phytophthora lilii]|uniref:Unnamed protein product n=1 Tax=Phytophthora lilii TaxID=2077276 RepID=A0A9W6UB28_9STRA|nr:unnamed protein product [Phytophthora lilii]